MTAPFRDGERGRWTCCGSRLTVPARGPPRCLSAARCGCGREREHVEYGPARGGAVVAALGRRHGGELQATVCFCLGLSALPGVSRERPVVYLHPELAARAPDRQHEGLPGTAGDRVDDQVTGEHRGQPAVDWHLPLADRGADR